MDALRIQATDDSPEVIFDPAEGRLEISGKSLPEDVVDFYQPVLDWLKEYCKNPAEHTELQLKLQYFNTASAKLLLDLLMILEQLVEQGKDVLVKWFSLSEDEDMQEAGLEYEEMVEVPFEHLSY